MTLYFVTGTDTDVGKTIATAAVAAVLTSRGQRVAVIKPAQTGVAGTAPGDAATVARLVPEVTTREGVRLPDPLAPERAATLSGVELPSLVAQHDLIAEACADHDSVLVEGAGGVTVNVGRNFSLLDLAHHAAEQGRTPRWLVVARSGLGTLNHTALTVQAITHRGFSVEGIIVGAWPADPGLADLHNREDLARAAGVPVIGVIPAGVGDLPSERFRRQALDWVPYLSA